MIITVTLNPAVDKTVTVEKLCPGELNKVCSSREDAGGKGINVSKTIQSLGGKSIATGFLGGLPGDGIARTLKELEIEADFVQIDGQTRTNLKIADADGCVTEVNEPGPVVSGTECERLEEKLRERISPGDMVILSGSLPKGISVDFYGKLTEKMKALGASVFVDADGEAFVHAVDAKPDVMKPNLAELERYFSKEADGMMQTEETTIVALLHDLVEDTDYTIDDLISMGFDKTVTDAIALMTHADGVDYMEYVRMIKKNPIATAVKLADLKHNSDLTRLDVVDETAIARKEKYRKAIALLEE